MKRIKNVGDLKIRMRTIRLTAVDESPFCRVKTGTRRVKRRNGKSYKQDILCGKNATRCIEWLSRAGLEADEIDTVQNSDYFCEEHYQKELERYRKLLVKRGHIKK